MEISQPTALMTRAPDNGFSLDANASPEEVAEAFESVFATMLIKEMRATLSEGLFGGDKSDVLGGLFDQHIGKAISTRGGLGIREMLLSQLPSEESNLTESIGRYKENTHVPSTE